jgi:HEAT repeat protein
MLRTADFRKSRCLVDQLPRFGESAVPPLTALLHEGPEQGRVNAAAGLAGLREQALPATPALELALDDPSASVRWMVLNALASIEPRSPTLTLDVLRRLQRATPGTLESETLIYTVSHMGSLPPEALPTFAHVLEGLPSYDRRAAEETIDAISHVAAPQRMVLLAQLVGDKDAGRSWHATLAMGRSGLLAMPVLLSRLIDHPGQRGDAYWRALDWAWTVASAPSLSTYYQTDMTALMRQLRDPRPSGKAQALKRLAGLAPAFQLQLSDSWHGDEENRMPQVRCEVLDALADGAGRVADQAERQSMIAIAVSLRQAAPNSSCPIQIY